MYRTDPLKDDGTFDLDFFASSEFVPERDSLVRYLEIEGFSSFSEDFFIDYRSRRWHVKPDKRKKK